MQRTFGEIIKKFGLLDILVNNAGIAHVGNVLTTEEEDFDEMSLPNDKLPLPPITVNEKPSCGLLVEA